MSNPEQKPATCSPPSVVTAAMGGIITVEVGLDRQRFLVHKTLLSYYSEYFAGATRGLWEEAQTGVVPLHDIEPTTFRLFVHWLYKGTIPKNGSDKEWSPILDRVINCTIKKRHLNLHTRELFPLLIKAYIFGDRFLAIGFRRDISERISDNLSRIRLWGTTFQQVIQHAFTHIPFDRPILQHLADICCKDWYEDEDEEADIFAQKDLPQAFIMRVLRRFGEVREMKQMNIQSHVRCYYEHASEEDEKRCGKAHMVYNEKRDYGYFPSG